MPACALCHEERELLESHFMPAAFYKNLLKSSPGHHPVVISRDVHLETSKQVTEKLLCSECEDRFNKLGEMWVLPLGWQADGSFPLREALKVSPGEHSGNAMVVHNATKVSGIDVDKLVYFGASIFWRGTQRWKGQPEAHRLKLGPYEEQLRMFLLGKAPFPKDCSICVGVNRAEEIQMAATGIFPYLKNRSQKDKFTQYNFAMMGLSFDLFVGKELDHVRRAMCILRGFDHPIFFADSAGAGIVDAFGRIMRTSRPVGKLAKSTN